MMDAIISPWVFYLIDASDKFINAFKIINMLSLIAFAISCIFYLIQRFDENADFQSITVEDKIKNAIDKIEYAANKLNELLDPNDENKISLKTYVTIDKEKLNNIRYWREDVNNAIFTIKDKTRMYEVTLQQSKDFIKIIDFIYRIVKISAICSIISGLIVLFIPSSTTIYKMMITSFITPDNIQTTVEITKNSLDTMLQWIVDAAIKIKETGVTQ